MRRHSLTITAAFLVLAVSVVVPAAADAGPLLSGYGGPGQGNQAILGSALVGGGSGGHGSGSGGAGGSGVSGSGSAGASSAGAAGSGTVTLSAGARARGETLGTARDTRGKHAKTPLAGSSATGSSSSSGSSSLTASRGGAGGSLMLGLSGADLLYILLAFGLLVFTGVLTRSLSREPEAGREAR